MGDNHKMTPEKVLEEWVKDKGSDYCQGFIDATSQFLDFIINLQKDPASNDTE